MAFSICSSEIGACTIHKICRRQPRKAFNSVSHES
nr:MAG TPA: hypothetical protein [Caudoviricetes sp.]